MSAELNLIIKPVYYKTYDNHPLAFENFKPYSHQISFYDSFKSTEDDILLATTTSSGKTRAAIYSLVDAHKPAIFVYPTNALLINQVQSIITALKEKNLSVAVTPTEFIDISTDFLKKGNPTKQNVSNSLWASHVHLKVLTSVTLTLYQTVRELRERTKGLIDLLRVEKPCSYLLTNFDVLYSLLHLKYFYSMQAIQYLYDYSIIIFDEFHIYSGTTLASLLHALRMFDAYHNSNQAFRRIYLSATPHPSVQRLLETVFSTKLCTITDVPLHQNGSDNYCAAAEIQLKLVAADPFDNINLLKAIIVDEINIKHPTVQDPLVIIVNSPFSARKLYEWLIKTFQNHKITIRIGEQPSLTKLQPISCDIIIGTSSIEVGIDFQTTRIIFEAMEQAAFMQRLGRVGRHTATAQAIALAPANVLVLLRSSTKVTLTRKELATELLKGMETTDNPFAEYFYSVQSRLPSLCTLSKISAIMNKNWNDFLIGKELRNEVLQALTDVSISLTADIPTGFQNYRETKYIFKNQIIKLELLNIIKWKPALDMLGFRGSAFSLLIYDPKGLALYDSPIPFFEVGLITALKRLQLNPLIGDTDKIVDVMHLSKEIKKLIKRTIRMHTIGYPTIFELEKVLEEPIKGPLLIGEFIHNKITSSNLIRNKITHVTGNLLELFQKCNILMFSAPISNQLSIYWRLQRIRAIDSKGVGYDIYLGYDALLAEYYLNKKVNIP